MTMILRSIFYSVLVVASTHSIRYGMENWRENPQGAKCLTGYMTDLQSWVDKDGNLIVSADMTGAIDISKQPDVISSLKSEMSRFRCSNNRRIQYLSLANCSLTHVPPVFQSIDSLGRQLGDTAEYITFFGNNFGMAADVDSYDVTMNASQARELIADDEFQRLKLSEWSFGFQDVMFNELKELDLRSCSINVIGDTTFRGMPKLENLYLSENHIHFINANALNGLKSLQHLDISRNHHYDINGIFKRLVFETVDIFQCIKLKSLDLSFTMISERNIPSIRRSGSSLQRLSLCYSGLGNLPDDVFNGTSLRFLDVSGNNEAFNAVNVFRGVENTLQVLYAEDVSLKLLHFFRNLYNLEILKLSHNEIVLIEPKDIMNVKNLQILDLDNNRFMSWFNRGFLNYLPNLKLFSLSNNNINMLTEEMVKDIQNISYISMFGNFIICSCNARDLYDIALENEFLLDDNYIVEANNNTNDIKVSFHTGFEDYNRRIRTRNNITDFCLPQGACVKEQNEIVGSYLLMDYDTSKYKCFSANNNTPLNFFQLPTCSQTAREMGVVDFIEKSWNRMLLFIIPVALLPILLFLFTFRKNLKYFLISVRNSATLSLISKNGVCDEDTIFNYDVFVSYCNEDRAWVLDNLLPHLEKDCNISVCLHERDFQVGLSILENIVSCMDRSRMIMLVISQPFLLSQWCQFEMHLAQHRLLETRREDLILILLEDIPKSLRPNTLHYLMLTKTYIVWPTEDSERQLFWRRMKKSLVTHKLKQAENISLA